jgi:LacI family transcriptional regulator
MNIYQIAKKAGVSIATVSRVINNSSNVKKETRQKVQAVLNEMNYTPNAIARSLAVNSTRTIGVLTTDVRDYYYASAIYSIEQEFRSLGYNVILCNTGDKLEKKELYMKILLEKKVDGIILVGSVFKEKEDNDHIFQSAERVPLVMLNGYLEGDNIYSIVCDDSYASFNIVKWLYDRGHRDIIYMYGVPSFSGLAKIDGFKQGMREMGLKIKPHTVFHTNPGAAGGYLGVQQLDELNCVYTAIVASEDGIAAGAMRGIWESGRKIPDDTAIFGFNDSEICLCTTPELSTVDNKVGPMSTEAVHMLYDVLHGSKVCMKIIFTPELVIRGST